MDIESIVKRLAHDKDLSSVQGFPGQVVMICSSDYPCKPDCPRCTLESYATSQREMRKGLDSLQEEAWARWRAFGGEKDARTNSDALVAAAYGWIAQELSAILEGKG